MIELLTLLLLALVNAFIIIGFYESTQYESKKEPVLTSDGWVYKEVFTYRMLLWRVRYYGDKILGDFWNKPFYACCTCMASVHSIIPYYFYLYISGNLSLPYVCGYPFYVFGLAGVVTVIVNKIN